MANPPARSLYVDQFADRKIGLAVGFVHAFGRTNQVGAGNWGSTIRLDAQLVTATGRRHDHERYDLPGFNDGLSVQNTHVRDDRDGLAGVLEFKPNSNFTSELDIYHAKIMTATKNASLKAQLGGLPITDGTVDGSGNITAGTFNLGANPNGLISDSENISDNDTLQSFGWRNTLKLNDTWKVTGDVSHNSAKRIERDTEVYGGITSADTLSFTTPNGFGVPQLTVGNPSAYTTPGSIVIRDQTGWSATTPPTAQDGYLKGPTTVDKIDALRLDFTHDLQDGMLQRRAVRRQRHRSHQGSQGGRSADRLGDRRRLRHAPIPGGFVRRPQRRRQRPQPPDLRSGRAALFPGAGPASRSSTTTSCPRPGTSRKASAPSTPSSTSTPRWARSRCAATWACNTSTRTSRRQASRPTSAPASSLNQPGEPPRRPTARSYSNVLPSLNLTGDLGNGNLLRFGAGVELARPNMTDMRNAFSVGPVAATCEDANGNPIPGQTNCTVLSGASGNPYLKPYKAKALDLSYEKYFQNKEGYLSGALFYKKLDTYIVQYDSGTYDFTTIAQRLGVAPAFHGGSYTGQYTTSVNGSGGNLKGFELTAQVPFSMLTSVAERAQGANGSFSDTTSSVKSPNTIGLNPLQAAAAGSIPLPGLSHLNKKLMVYYERAGFSAFIAENSRSLYVGSVANNTVGGAVRR